MSTCRRRTIQLSKNSSVGSGEPAPRPLSATYPHRLLPILQEPWQAPGRDAGFDAYFAAKRQTQPPTLARTELFSPGSRFSICTCSLTIKRPFARARHAAVQREFSSTVLWLRELKQVGRFTADAPLASGPCPKILPHRPPVCHDDDARVTTRNCYFSPIDRLSSSWQSEIIASRPKKCKRFFSPR